MKKSTQKYSLTTQVKRLVGQSYCPNLRVDDERILKTMIWGQLNDFDRRGQERCLNCDFCD